MLCVFRPGPYTFSIGDTRGFSEYTKGGVACQAKMPKNFNFVGFFLTKLDCFHFLYYVRNR